MEKMRRSLFHSVIALILCFSMLLGTTYAWFTNSVTSANNIIKAGNLDLEVWWTEDLTSSSWKNAEDANSGAIFDYDKWEPGYTCVRYIKLVNNGDLAFKYLLNVIPNGDMGILADVIDVYYVENAQANVDSVENMTAVGTLADVVGKKVSANGVLLPEGTSESGFYSGEIIVAIALSMQESAGNEYQGKSIGTSFSIELLATQYSYEEDVFGKDYDTDAEWPNKVSVGDNEATAPVTPDANNKLTADTALANASGKISATVPAGTSLAQNTTELTLSVSDMSKSEANITLDENEASLSVDVHIEGIAADNEAVIAVDIAELLPVGLNMGNYRLYHVEGGATVAMTLLADGATPAHNNYEYDPATGDVTLYLKSFSEVALVANNVNAWNGTVAQGFAGGTGEENTPYLIANADQFVYFGELISNDNGNYGDKYYKLIADINFGGEDNANEGKLFYPIGYHKVGEVIAALDADDAPEFVYQEEDPDYAQARVSVAAEDGETAWYTYGGSFKGTFDGNGNTVSNIYQNTWQLKGNYDGNYWNAAMGLFGYVNGGTVKNLTVDNFSSDGEFTPTGVIAAYATNSTFENIAITNCNPRVYNTGNGGIVGIGGNSDDPESYNLTFTNITIDNTNKISALWGSWDVACGGLVGMFRGAGHVNMTNCHVAAQIDVFNDVCGNYQYYWYRYAGMVIGSIRKHTTVNGYTVPDTTGITATDCTVHFGDWNDYYYCELVANSLASYTHDHQFSRLTEIASLDEIKSGDAWTKAGNFLLIGDDTKTCYHIVNKNGTLTQHLHTDAGEETVSGKTVLKEDKQIVYLPFNQIFQGYGWGVKNIGFRNDSELDFDGIKVLDREEANSINKFEAILNGVSIKKGTTLTIGEIFSAVNGEVAINTNTLKVFVSPVGENSTATAVFTPHSDWTQGTLAFDGVGGLKIVITDYTYCKETVASLTIAEPDNVDKFVPTNDLTFYHTLEGDTINKKLGDIFSAVENVAINSANVVVTVDNEEICSYTKNDSDWTQSTLAFSSVGRVTITITDRNYCNVATATVTVSNPEERDAFNVKFPNVDKYLYRVGNGNAITLSSLFGAEELPDGVTVSLEFAYKVGDVSATYVENESAWSDGTIKFEKTGVATITIDSNAFTAAKELTIEVVDAKNITSVSSSNGTDVVLLDNVTISSGGTVNYTNCTVYGNGFTFDVRGGMNKYESKQGHGIIIINGTTLDNLVVLGAVYDTYGAYTSQEDYTSAIDATNSIIQNCHISNCSTPIRANGVTVINTTLYGGTVANLIISGGTNTLEDVTTVNYNDDRGVLGFGIVISDGANETVKLVLNGELKQYNFVCENDISSVPDDNAKKLFNAMFDSAYSTYHFGTDSVYVNPGILSMVSTFDASDITNNTGNGYVGTTVSYTIGLQTMTGYLYALPASGNSVDNGYDAENDANKVTVQGDYLPTFEFDLGDQAISNDGADDTRYLTETETGVEALYQSNEAPITLDLTKLATVTKYSGINYNVSASYKDNNGNVLGTDTTVSLTSSGTLVFTVTDNVFYDKDGNKLDKSVERTYEVPLTLSIKQAAVKNAELNVNETSLTGTYTAAGTFDTSQYLSFNPLDAITVTDYDVNGTGTTVDLTANISTTTVSYVNTTSGAWGGATITITYTDGRVLTVVLGSTSMNSPGASNGGKTITVTNGTVKSDGKVAKSSATGGTWPITSYSFKGNNGSTVTSSKTVTVTFKDSSGCVTGDTLVTLADGTQKRIDEVTYNDQLLVWDFFKGEYATVPSAIIFYHGDELYDVLALNFDDGTTVKTINVHGFYDVESNRFEFIEKSNVENYIGHEFVKQSGDSYTTVKLIGYDVYEEYTGCYSIQSALHNNFITEGMFSITIPAYEGWFDYFEIGDGMKYDEEKMQADIEKYGLYTYGELSDYATYEQFVAFNGPYLKVLVGRGVVTFDDIVNLINTYVNG